MSEAPVAIDASVVVDKDSGVEAIDAYHSVGILVVPVAHLEGSVGPMALGYQRIAATRLVVGEQIVGFLSCRIGDDCHIWGEKHIGSAGAVEGFAFGIFVYAQYLAIVAPTVQRVDRCRPYHLLASAVVVDAAVVRAVDIDALPSWLVRVFKHVGLAVRDVLP